MSEVSTDSTDAAKLRAAGVEVTLRGGKRYPLRLDFEGLYIIEEEFAGGLDDLVGHLSPETLKKAVAAAEEAHAAAVKRWGSDSERARAADKDLAEARARLAEKTGWKRGRIRAIGTAMEAALVHTGMTREEIRDLLEFKQIVVYLDALIDAFNQAMPEGPVTSPLARRNGAGSPGGASTTSRRSGSAARTRPSGV
jgi:hypothetical protein